MFDAYTVKKVLPRLVIAAIFIQLSWEIFTLLIEITSQIAWGVEGLLLAPFGGSSALELQNLISESAVGASATGLLAGIAAAVAVGTVVSSGYLLLLGLSALVGIVIAFFLLAVREIVLLILVVTAPIALVAWILPNTEKVWKLWWESFSKLLLVYPLILLIVAMGRIFAAVTIQGTGSENAFLELAIIVIGFFGPYYLIPKTFQVAGSAFANITGMVNDRGRGVFDRLKKGRQESIGKTWDRTKSGNRFQGGTASNRRGMVNRALQTAALSSQGGLTLSPATRRARMQTARNLQDFNNAKKFLQENEAMGAIKGDDDKMWAMMNADSEQDVRDELMRRAPGRFYDRVALDNATAEIMRAKREGGARVSQIAGTLAQFGTGTGFNYRHDGVDDDMLNAVIAASGDDNGLAGRIIAEGRPMASQSGRTDLAGGGFAHTMQVLEQRRADMRNGGGIFSADEARASILQDVINSNAGAAVAGKAEGVRQLAPIMRANTEAALMSGDTKLAARELAKLAGKHDAAASIAPQNAEALADGVLDQTFDVTALPDNVRMMLTDNGNGTYDPRIKEMTYSQAIERIRSTNPDFLTMRREYQTAATAAAAAAAGAPPGGAPPGGAPPGPVV